MIEAKKGDILLVEYQPGMFRKVTVKGRFGPSLSGYIRVNGLLDYFNRDTGLQRSGYSNGFRKKLHPFDEAKLTATKHERNRRALAAMLEQTDWNALSLGELEKFKALFAGRAWPGKVQKEKDDTA